MLCDELWKGFNLQDKMAEPLTLPICPLVAVTVTPAKNKGNKLLKGRVLLMEFPASVGTLP